jgi:hypothetical protein
VTTPPSTTTRSAERRDAARILLDLELDGPDPFPAEPGHRWEAGAVSVELVRTETGHGFGLSECVTVLVSIAAGASSDLAADAVRTAVKRVVRRARTDRRSGDGSREGLTDLIEAERADDAEAGD